MKTITTTGVAALFLLLTAQTVTAQATARLLRYHIKPDQHQPFRKALSNYVFSALKAPGNIMAEAYYEETDSTILWVIERWSNRAALGSHGQHAASKAIVALAKNGLASSADTIYMKDLEPLPKAAYHKKPAKQDQPITIMLFVDAKAGTEDHFKTTYHKAMPAFRGEPGVIAYQLSQTEKDKTRFVTYEKFRGQEAFQYHLRFPPIEPVIQYLHTSIKEQPFEKGLHRLVEIAPLYSEQ